jgi:hypothetical protein
VYIYYRIQVMDRFKAATLYTHAHAHARTHARTHAHTQVMDRFKEAKPKVEWYIREVYLRVSVSE